MMDNQSIVCSLCVVNTTAAVVSGVLVLWQVKVADEVCDVAIGIAFIWYNWRCNA